VALVRKLVTILRVRLRALLFAVKSCAVALGVAAGQCLIALFEAWYGAFAGTVRSDSNPFVGVRVPLVIPAGIVIPVA
jgi:hypothetical protein